MNAIRYKVTFFVILLSCSFLLSCKKNSPPLHNHGPAVQTAGGLEFILQTTDMNGNFKSKFTEGENFKISLSVRNNSSQRVTLCHCFLTYTNRNLLAVYTAEPVNSPKYGRLAANDSIGKPWSGSGGAFIAPVTFVPGKTTISYSLPWHIPDTTVQYSAPDPVQYLGFHVIQNPFLPPSTYYTKFAFVYQGAPINLKYYFNIIAD